MIEVTTCSVCGNSQFTTLFSCEDYTLSRKTFTIIKCNSCSVLITSPRPADDEINQYYESADYVSHTAKANNFINFLYLNIRKITLKQKQKLLEKICSEKTILDYGCGTGSLITHLQKNSWLVKGYEPNESARKIAELNCEVFNDPKQISGTYSLISLWHVLEHTSNPSEIINHLKQHLKPNGKLLIAVPNHKSYDALYYQNYWAAYDVPRHLWHFNKESMEQFLQNNGLKLLKIEPMYFDAYYVSLLSETYRKNTFTKYFKAFVNGFLSNRKAKRTGEYSSLIYIAGK